MELVLLCLCKLCRVQIVIIYNSQARILSIVAGTDVRAACYNVTRFYGAVLFAPTAEYRVVLGK